MFSATKFIAAGTIVALSGGFLLAGVLTTQQSDEVLPAAVASSPTTEATSEPTEAVDPSVRTDLLPGVELTVGEVGPGVFRVVNDGVRDLVSSNNIDVVAGQDDGIWVVRPQRFFRLGSDALQEWATKKPEIGDFEVAPDGMVWTVQDKPNGEAAIQSFDGQGWRRHKKSIGGATLEITSDGTVWAVWEDLESDSSGVGYLGADGWTAIGEGLGGHLHVSDAGDIWSDGGAPFVSHVHRYVDGDWQYYEDVRASRFDVGPDGTFWGPGNSGGWGAFDGTFYRFDGTEWTTFEGLDWMTEGGEREPRVAPDGSVWIGPRLARLLGLPGQQEAAVCEPGVGGVTHFDGETWSRHLSDRCIVAMDIAADGSVWLLADGELYVITPEAVAATE